MSNQQNFHNSGGLIAFLGSIIFVFAFFFYIIFGHHGVDLGENVTEPAKPGEIKFDLSSVKDPWVTNEQVANEGKRLYKQNCASCHGQNGDLVGGVPTARHLVNGEWKGGAGIIAHFKVLQNGLKDANGNQTAMVSFKAQLSSSERWAVLQFIETITKNKSQDRPEDVAAFAATAD